MRVWVALNTGWENDEVIGVSLTFDGAKEFCQMDYAQDSALSYEEFEWVSVGPETWISHARWYRIEEHPVITEMG